MNAQTKLALTLITVGALAIGGIAMRLVLRHVANGTTYTAYLARLS